MAKLSPRLNLTCKECKSKKILNDLNINTNINIKTDNVESSKIVTLKGKNKKTKNKNLF